jgi:transposase InsO family protein
MAYKVRDLLCEMRIKHRPIPPRTPHLTGKGERVQQTMLTEFYATTTMDSFSLEEDLGVWVLDYNARPCPWLAGQNADGALVRAPRADPHVGRRRRRLRPQEGDHFRRPAHPTASCIHR